MAQTEQQRVWLRRRKKQRLLLFARAMGEEAFAERLALELAQEMGLGVAAGARQEFHLPSLLGIEASPSAREALTVRSVRDGVITVGVGQ